MKKSIVKGVAVSLVLCYVPAVLVLYFTKFIELDFNNIKDIVKIVAPFAVLLIDAALLLSGKLDKYIEKDVGTNPEFDKLLEKIMSDLESLVNEPVGQDNFKDTVESISESHEEIKSRGSVFLFPEFKSYFDSLLDRMIRAKVLKMSEGKLVTSNNKLRRLNQRILAVVVLSAQLMMKNPMLSVLYPEDKIPYIRALSQISVGHCEETELQDAVKKIEQCLIEEVYGCTSYSQLNDKISSMSHDMIKKENLLNGISTSALKSMSRSKREGVLIKLLIISRLKYYCITNSEVILAISNADRTIVECGKDDDLASDLEKPMRIGYDYFRIKGDTVIFEMREGSIVKVKQPNMISTAGTISPASRGGEGGTALQA